MGIAQPGNDREEDLAKSGYRPDMKVIFQKESFCILAACWNQNLVNLGHFFSQNKIFVLVETIFLHDLKMFIIIKRPVISLFWWQKFAILLFKKKSFIT